MHQSLRSSSSVELKPATTYQAEEIKITQSSVSKGTSRIGRMQVTGIRLKVNDVELCQSDGTDGRPDFTGSIATSSKGGPRIKKRSK